MLSIQTLTVGEMESNCYLVSDPETNQCLIIDPGDDADYITQTILENKLKPITIILTHGHFDHVLGCLELKLNFSVPIMLHKNDLKLYSSANQSALHWLNPKGALSGKETLKVPPVDQYIKEGDEIKIGNERLKVIETPGHTPGSVSLFYIPSLRGVNDEAIYTNSGSPRPATAGLAMTEIALFTGDTLFANGVGRTDFSYSSPDDLQTSLTKLKAISCQLPAVIYPGHGPITLLSEALISS